MASQANQADISQSQAVINKVLADLPFTVSMEVAYDASQRRIDLTSKGRSNVYLWGTKLGDGPRLLRKSRDS